jgi:hypothetical protein
MSFGEQAASGIELSLHLHHASGIDCWCSWRMEYLLHRRPAIGCYTGSWQISLMKDFMSKEK